MARRSSTGVGSKHTAPSEYMQTREETTKQIIAGRGQAGAQPQQPVGMGTGRLFVRLREGRFQAMNRL
jgi:hypothetical protein